LLLLWMVCCLACFSFLSHWCGCTSDTFTVVFRHLSRALLALFLQVLKVVASAVDGVLAGQKKQDKLKGRINHEFNKVSSCNCAVSAYGSRSSKCHADV
jgi:hypothetical protein